MSRVDELEAEVAGARADRAELGRLLAVARLRRDLARELVAPEADGAPLSVGPLVASVLSVLASLGAALAAYAAALGGGPPWALAGMLAAIAALVVNRFAHGPGAGGSARPMLRGLAFGLSVLSAVVLVLAVVVQPLRP